MVHANCLVHLYETKCYNHINFCEKLKELPGIDPKATRYLMSNEDCPVRKFGDWRAQKVTAPREEWGIEDGAAAVSYECRTNA